MFVLAISREVTSERASTGIQALHFSIQISALKSAKLDHFVKRFFKASTSTAHLSTLRTQLENNEKREPIKWGMASSAGSRVFFFFFTVQVCQLAVAMSRPLRSEHCSFLSRGTLGKKVGPPVPKKQHTSQ